VGKERAGEVATSEHTEVKVVGASGFELNLLVKEKKGKKV
jgi:hypothetical protein